MFFQRNLYSRSEQWRLEWGLRTCVSVAVVAFLYLYEPTKDHLTRYGVASTSLAAAITVFVKDITLGATLANAWTCILGSFIGSFLCWLIFLLFRQFYEDSVPLALLLATIFCFITILQYSEMTPVTKKFADCLVAIHLISNQNRRDPSFYIWGIFLAVCIGCACAMVGCLVPLPVRLAGTELKERVHYFSDSLASLVQDCTVSWASAYKTPHTALRSSTGPEQIHDRVARRATLSISSTPGSSPVRTLRKTSATTATTTAAAQCMGESEDEEGGDDLSASQQVLLKHTENMHWRKLRLLLHTIAVFKLQSVLHSGRARKKAFNTRFLRLELINYLQECLPYLLSRNLEAQFGPSRRMARRCAKFVKLLQDAMLIVARLETHIENMEQLAKYHYLYAAFFSRPNLRYGAILYASSLQKTIVSISAVLCAQSSLHDELLPPSGTESYEAIDAAARLLKARTYFDAQYLRARKDIFYPDIFYPDDPVSARKVGSHTQRSGGGPLGPVGLKAYAKAMLEVNSVVFLLDTLSRLLLEFLPLDELAQLANRNISTKVSSASQLSTEKYEQGTDLEDADLFPSDMLSAEAQDEYRALRKLSTGVGAFLWELFPTRQAHLWPCFQYRVFHPGSNSSSTGGRCVLNFTLPRSLRQRLVSSLTVSVAMTLAALYGIINRRPQASLASLTIAFLAGGAVSGINVMTCINRAAGTAVACVYSVMVAYIISNWTSETAKNLFVGLAVVLIQVPSVYVRSFPLYSYSGTVTGFTTAMLLLTSNATTTFAVNRIIDTYVGVTIYLLLEFGAAATFTEDEILSDMRHVFEGIEEKYTNFHRNFHFFKAAEDSCEEVRSRIRGGTLTPLEVTVELQRIDQLRQDVQVRKGLEVDSIQAVIRRQQLLAPFYRSEPAVFRPAVFPAALLQDSIALQQQAVSSIQVMIWAVKACDGSFDDKVERLIMRVHGRVSRRAAADVEDHTALTASDSYQSNLSTASIHSHSAKAAISLLPEFKSLLQPLEPHFIEVQKFVSAVLVFLSSTLDQVGNWESTLEAFKDPALLSCRQSPPTAASRQRSLRRCAGVLAQLSAVTESRHAAQMGHITADFPHQVYERLSYGRDDVYEIGQVDQLYLRYQALISGFQDSLNTDASAATTTQAVAEQAQHQSAEENGRRSPGRPRKILSNREIVIVNTFLASTQQLIAALHGLTVVVSRMQAHRDIRVTQDGKHV